MERLAATEDGLVEVEGRWFGVRGRRFVRPTLTLTLADGGPPRRWLADLEHKPWAAEDGEPWMAAFPVDVELDSASAIELSVAPDIEIMLRAREGATGAAAAGPVAARSRSPVAKQDPHGRRPSARAQDLERLSTRLSAAQAALDRERERRATVDTALEEQRAESRRLSAELARARAELDLGRTVQRESEAIWAELDSTRRQLRAAERRYEELVAEARAAAPAPPAAGSGSAADDPEPTRDEPRGRDRREEADRLRDRGPDVRPRPVAPHRVDRPVNPALQSRPNWGWRALALLVIIAVVVAVWVVLHSTILH